jgi:uncharacterized protein YlxW (UPF0749 family)
MGISLSEAAKLVGMSKNGVVKAIKAGKVSGQKNIHGQWEVDPAELTRVYKALEPVSDNQNEPVRVSESKENNDVQKEIHLLREQINLLKDQLDDAKGREDKILKMMDEQITNMRMLADLREKKEEEGRGFWKRLFS